MSKSNLATIVAVAVASVGMVLSAAAVITSSVEAQTGNIVLLEERGFVKAFCVSGYVFVAYRGVDSSMTQVFTEHGGEYANPMRCSDWGRRQ